MSTSSPSARAWQRCGRKRAGEASWPATAPIASALFLTRPYNSAVTICTNEYVWLGITWPPLPSPVWSSTNSALLDPFRAISRRIYEPVSTLNMWWCSRCYVGLPHISSGHRPYSVIHPVGIICRPRRPSETSAGHVANSRRHVQARRRSRRVIPGHYTYSNRRCALCKYQ